ncbi:MAG TPA: OmpA family protein [Gemmatimonadaceae bacterium]|nr:OmpA family protein [Gemmatimonadaceae bacterium]
MSYILKQRTAIALLAIGSLGLSACASMSKKERGAATGAAAGAAIGGVIGNQTGSTARGAILGAIVGGAAGAVIGHQMDQQAKEIDASVEGATVERVGEGIQVTFASGLLFPHDSDVLQPAARANLTELANSLKKYPESQLLIVGHTDDTGSDSYNMALSQRRSDAAAAFLQSQGIARSRIQTSGKGESEPVATNESDAGRQQNRRVEVAIYASEAYRQEIMRRNQ